MSTVKLSKVNIDRSSYAAAWFRHLNVVKAGVPPWRVYGDYKEIGESSLRNYVGSIFRNYTKSSKQPKFM